MGEKLLVKNIGLLQTPVGSGCHCGAQQGENQKLKNAAVLCEDGKITAVTADSALPAGSEGAAVYDAGGRLVTPGLVDAHTHLVFGGWRQGEIPLKLRGATYLDILRAGGGILDTVRHTRAASEDELFEKSRAFLDEMLALGVTTCEIKSGYGLDLETELKQLRVIRRLNSEHPVDIAATYLGAHAIPDEYKGRADEYVDFVCQTVIPRVAEEKLASFCDVFCEDSVFDVAQSRRVLEAGKKHGLRPKIHADEIEEIGGAGLSGEVGAVSAEHLIATGERGMEAMRRGGVIACLLPQTSFYLGKTFAPARRMIELGIPVALASDFNPGSCPSFNLQLSINLGLLRYQMLPEEILTAVTVNAACACGRGNLCGTLEAGKQADLVVWDAPDWEMVCYRFGSNQTKAVVKNGRVTER